MTIDTDKRAAAAAAVEMVRDGMLVGLGTGSTAAHLIALLVDRRPAIEVVATSEASARAAREGGLVVRDFAGISRVDLTIDGADEIDSTLVAVKGAGGAMLREKVVAAASDRMVVIADASKRVDRVGAAKLPVEVLPFAERFVARALAGLFERVEKREGVETDNGNVILDGHGWRDADPQRMAAAVASIPGVVGHGLFLSEVDAAIIAEDGVVTRLERRALGR